MWSRDYLLYCIVLVFDIEHLSIAVCDPGFIWEQVYAEVSSTFLSHIWFFTHSQLQRVSLNK
jgi:hypothetical protein